MEKKIVCHDVWGNKTEVDSSQLIFRPSVYGILIENGKILLSKQWDGYDMPGGGVDANETLEEALKREFIEETGLEIVVGKIVYCGTSFFNPKYSSKNAGQYWNSIVMYFLVKKIGGEISIKNCDEDEKKYIDLPEWIELEKMRDLKIYSSIDIDVIKEVLNNFK
jgi:8-oxo-dGTP pyrophosphatase MutT (NUDIX family)